MQFTGTLKKMLVENTNPVQYFLDFDDNFLIVNQLIGKEITITHTGYCCKNCGLDKPIKASGYCKECFFIVPQTLESVIRPEKSKAHLGIEERDLEWEKNMQLQPHIVYLANSSGIKVGVTRKSQIPTRWIDQGAGEAVFLAVTENRYEAGMIEVALANQITDKTNYRKMLTSKAGGLDLIEKKYELKEFIPEGFSRFFVNDDSLTHIEYPIENYPEKIKSVKLLNNKVMKQKVKGIKGQYLIFENNEVMNVRSHEGFVVNISI